MAETTIEWTTLAAPAYRELFTHFDDENPTEACFTCSICGRSTDDEPCPDHAPMAVPGLRLVDCAAEPRHLLWVHDRDDYGVPCYLCLHLAQVERERQARQCRHWGWRKWRVTSWLSRKLYTLGVTTGGGVEWGNGHDACVTLGRLRGERSYILGVPRETWHCWRSGHQRGESVDLGFCGKCVPWPCCGSQRADHKDDCAEAVA